MSKYKKIIVLLIMTFSLLNIGVVKAASKDINVTNISVIDKSGTITVVDPVLSSNEITSNITFNQKDDFVTFELTLKNNESDKYKIESIKDNNTNNNLKVEYEYDSNYMSKGETKKIKIKLKLTYKNKLVNVDKISFNDLQIIINLVNEDGDSSEIIINPTTGDSILHYLVLLIIALTGLIFVIKKKKKIGRTLLVLPILLLPFAILAKESYKINIKFTNIDIIGEFETYNITINPDNGEPVIVRDITYGEQIGELPSNPSKEGYTFDKWVDNKGNEVTSSTIITEQITIKAKYNVIEYNITYDYAGGSANNPSKYTIEDEITLNNPSKQGYTFSGWTGSNGDELQTSVTIAKGSTGPKNYVAHYSANQNTAYKVKHRYQDYNLTTYTEETENLTGPTDETVYPAFKEKTGFINPEHTEALLIKADGTSELIYTYQRDSFAFSITDRTYIDPSSTADGTYLYETPITVKAQERDGYTFKWNDDNTNYERTFTLEDATSLTPIYTANTNTPYKVKHYKMDLDGENYTLADTQNLTGTTGSEITPAVNTYTGFTSPSTQTTTISGTGDTVVEYRYTRNQQRVTISNPENIEEGNISGDYYYGDSITLTAKEIPGYTFDKWSNEETDNPLTIVVGTSDINVGPVYLTNQLTVTAYGNEGTIESTTGWTGTGTSATKEVDANSSIGTLPDASRNGYVLTGWNTKADGTGTNVTTSTTISEATSIYAEWIEANATFDTGSNVNAKMKRLAGNSSATSSTADTNITSIQKSSTKPDISLMTSKNIVSASNSTVPIYMWFDNGTIYWWSEDNTPSLNQDSSYMFYVLKGLTSLNLSDFNTSNVTNMSYMFKDCRKITTIDLGDHFDTSNVTNMSSMFFSCTKLQILDLGDKFDTSNVTNMYYMFSGCSSLISLDLGENFDTSNVTNIANMFQNCSSLTSIDLGDKFDTSNVTNTDHMFSDCNSLTTLDLGDNFNTSNVTKMGGMFFNCSSLTSLDLGDKFDTSQVTDISGMFYSCSGLTSIDLGDKFDTSNVTTMYHMFDRCRSITTLDLGDKFDTSNVTNTERMFDGCSSLTSLDLGDKFDTSNVTNMSFMFEGCSSLTTIYAPNSFITTNITSSDGMFYNDTNLVGGAGTVFDSNHIDAAYAHIDEGVSNPGYFTGRTSIPIVFNKNSSTATGDMSNQMVSPNIETTLVANTYTNPGYMFVGWNTKADGTGTSYMDEASITITKQTILYAEWIEAQATFDTGQNVNKKMKRLAGNSSASYTTSDTNITTIQKSPTAPDISQMTSKNIVSSSTSVVPIYMWYDSGTIYWWSEDTTPCLNQDSSYMFMELYYLKSLDLSDFVTNNVTNMSSMFDNCRGLTNLNFGDKFETSNVTKMSNMFNGCKKLTSLDLGDNFDTSNVTNMYQMFRNCNNLTNLDLGDKFDTSNVTNMSYMFYNCNSLTTLDMGDNFDTSNVENMNSMFSGCSSLTSLDLGDNFDTGNVISMNSMFCLCSNLTSLDLGDNFDTSNVTNMNNMFEGCGKLTNLDLGDKFNTSNVKRMDLMFYQCKNLTTLDLGDNFDTSNVTNMNNMFYQCKNLTTLDLGDNFDTSNVTTMSSMFSGCSSLTSLDLGDNFDTGNVISMNSMFYGCSSLTTIYVPASFVTTNVSSSTNMFTNDTNLVGGVGTIFDSNHIDAAYAHIDGGTSNPGYFTGRTSIPIVFNKNSSTATGDMANQMVSPNIETTLVANTYTNPGYMFVGWNTKADGTGTSYMDEASITITKQTVLYAQWIEAKATFDTGKNVNTKMKKLAGNSSATYTSKNTNIKSIQKSLTAPDLSLMTEKNIVSDSTSLVPIYMWYDTGKIYWWSEDSTPYLNENCSLLFNLLDGLTSIDLNSFNTSKVTNMNWMFFTCNSLITLDLGNNFDTSNVTTMVDMFSNDKNLEALYLGNKFDTSNVTNMSYMFYNCNSLTTLDMGDNFDTSNVENMNSMFYGCNSLETLDLGNKFDTSNVTNMHSMFEKCSSLTSLDLGDNFDTSNVTDMQFMFRNCNNLTSLDLGNKFDTSSVTVMSLMFYDCSSLTSLDFGDKFDTSQVTDMAYMFQKCSSLTSLDLRDNFDTSKVTDMIHMFSDCTSLTTIYAPSSFVITNVTSSTDMFTSDTNLVGGAGTVYDSDHIDKEYAHLDGGTSNPGYFTARPTIQYTVTFDTDGGSSVPSQIISNGGTVIRPSSDPTKTGYIFDNWYSEDTYQTLFDFDNTNITSNTTIYGHFIEDTFPVVFSETGECVFNGSSGFLTGDNCTYADGVNKYIDTGINLYNTENHDKDFEIGFTIVSYKYSENVNQATFVNTKLEGNSYPGLVFRKNNDGDKSLLDLSSRKTSSLNERMQFNYTDGIKVKIYRITNEDTGVQEIFYSINDEEKVLLNDLSQFNPTFNLSVWFGAAPTNASASSAQRILKGTLKDMYIKLGTY